MPRRESYATDDEDDDIRRRAGASGGGGIPAWVWIGGGCVAIVLLITAGLGFTLFTSRQAQVRQHEAVARAEMASVEMDMARAEMRNQDHDHDALPEEGLRPAPGGALPFTRLTTITNLYRTDPNEADARFKQKRVRTELDVRHAGEGWVGVVLPLTPNLPADHVAPDVVPNVVFELPGFTLVKGARYLIEGTCAGVRRDPITGPRLTFTDCRVVPR